jgi:Zn-finger nucleic acid-binding protein
MIGTGIAAPPATRVKLEPVQYAPCPICKNLMNRLNFAHTSGVIVDVCTSHGTWFDSDELRRVLEFISAGGLEAARARELRKTPEAASTTINGALPASSADDPWQVVRPFIEQNPSTTIIRALVSFTSRKTR